MQVRMHNILKQNTLARHSRRRLREEKGGTSVLNVMLDIAGLIPGVGEYFDAINALLYAKKGEWLLAALSLISAIPAIGDIVGKGGKLAVWATKTFPKAAGTTVKYGPKIVEAIKLLKIALDENKELIESILKRAEKNEEMKKHIPKIREAIASLRGDTSTLPANLRSVLQGSNENFMRITNKSKNGNILTSASGTTRKHPVSQVGLSEGLLYHVSRGISLEDPVWRPGTPEFFDLFREAKALYREGGYIPTESEQDILESDIGEWALYEGMRVPLDFPMWDDNEMNEGADKKPYTSGPGIILSRLGGFSAVKQTNDSAPERFGVWAFIAPYFEPFLVASTNDAGVVDPDGTSRYRAMKRAKGKEPSLKLRKSRYVGLLYTRISDVPGAMEVDRGNGWYLVDADSLRKYVFGRLRPDEFDWQSKNIGNMKRPEAMARTSKDHYEVFIPRNKGKFIGNFNKMNEGAENNFLPEAKYKGREVTLGAKGAKRSGGRAHVYVRDPDTGKVKRISFGSGAPDAMGDSESHRKRRKSFGNRHRCSQNKNKLSASYWACRATKMFGRNIPGWW